MNSNFEPSSDFTDKIKKWVVYDLKIEQLNKELKEIRQEKTQIENKITLYIENNHLQDSIININNGQHLKYTEQNSQTSLSFKFLEECLLKYLNNKEETNNILEFIKKNRISKKEVILKKNNKK